MKPGKQWLLFLSVGVLLGAALVLNSTGILAQAGSNLIEFTRQERNELNAQLSQTQSRIKVIQLEPLSIRQAALAQQLGQTEVQRDQVRAVLAQPINKTAIISVLFTTARAYSLEINRMTLSGLTDAGLAGVPVSAVPLTVTVEGDMLNLVAFISRLNTLYTYGAVDSVAISNAPAGGRKPYADIKFTLYSIQDR